MDLSGFPNRLFSNSSELTSPAFPALTPEIIQMIGQMQQTGQLERPTQELSARGVWNRSEDETLLHAVTQLGTKSWSDIAKCVPSRSGKQCRERWINCLCPHIRHEPFEAWEDQIIIDRQRELGNRWSLISKQLPGRTTNAIKNRWYSALKSQVDGTVCPKPSSIRAEITEEPFKYSFAMTIREPDPQSDSSSTDL
jgi:hypothetical protein